MLWSLLAAAEKAQDFEARQSCAVCGATGQTLKKFENAFMQLLV